MMYTLKRIVDKNEKSDITNNVLRKLPEWFGIEESIVEYVNSAKEYQNHGIGKKLLEKIQEILRDNNYKFLLVKTLGESHPDIYYKKTRQFYTKTGFYPLEEINQIWGKDNPCLIMVKTISE